MTTKYSVAVDEPKRDPVPASDPKPIVEIAKPANPAPEKPAAR